MTNLLTTAEFASLRNISQKLDTGKIEEAISLAQQSDLLEMLGEFLFDVLKNKDEAIYSDLMNGSEFEYNGETYEQAGIKALLADYVHARYVYLKPVNDTAFGFKFKETQDGTSVDRNYLRDMQKQNQVDAGIKFKFINLYLCTNPDLFPRYYTRAERDKYSQTSFNGSSFSSQRLSKL